MFAEVSALGIMPPKFPLHPLQTESTVTTVIREAKAQWPFLMGFGVTGFLIFKVAAGITDEDVKNSKFSNPKGHAH